MPDASAPSSSVQAGGARPGVMARALPLLIAVLLAGGLVFGLNHLSGPPEPSQAVADEIHRLLRDGDVVGAQALLELKRDRVEEKWHCYLQGAIWLTQERRAVYELNFPPEIQMLSGSLERPSSRPRRAAETIVGGE